MSMDRWIKGLFIKKDFIPDNDDLYRRVLPLQFNPKKGKFTAPSFMLRNDENGLSVNWERYSTPEESAICPVKPGKKYYVGGLYAKIPRNEQLEVNHEPTRNNKSHSLIIGKRLIESKYEVAEVLAENCRPLIINIT